MSWLGGLGRAAMLDSEAFRRWFGESKVLDWRGPAGPEGRPLPLVVYHGAPNGRGLYAEGFLRSPQRGSAFFATDNYAMAESYADVKRAWDFRNAEPGVIPLYLSIQNPLVLDWGGKPWRGTAKMIEKARAGGHDGAIIHDVIDYYNLLDNKVRKGQKKPPSGTVYVWFSPSQAKSAAEGPVIQSGHGAERGRPITGSGPNRGTWDAGDANILHGWRRR